MTRLRPLALVYVLLTAAFGSADQAMAACSSPTAEAGALNWSGTSMQQCDGSNWKNILGSTPTNNAELTTKAYVDAAIAGASGAGPLKVYDKDSVALGYFALLTTGGAIYYFPTGTATSKILQFSHATVGTVYFASTNCSGTSYMQSTQSSGQYYHGYACTGASTCTTSKVIPNISDYAGSVTYQSFRDSGGVCTNGSSPLALYTTQSIPCQSTPGGTNLCSIAP